MDLREDRWFVRFRGHTLGPLTSEQVKTSLRKGELGHGDKIASSRNPAWSTIGSHPDFSSFYQTLHRPDLGLQPVPSVDALRRKREARAEIPSASSAAVASQTPSSAAYSAPRGAAARQETSLFAFESSDEAPSLKSRLRAAMPVRPAPAPAPVPAVQAASQEEKSRKKRVAAPGKKLGRPRKYPRPEDLSIADVVAPILSQGPGASASPIYPEKFADEIPSRPIVAPEAAPALKAASKVESPVEPTLKATVETAAETTVEVPAEAAEEVPMPTDAAPLAIEPKLEAAPEAAPSAPAFVPEAEPAPALARPEIPAAAATSEERLGAESLSLLQSLRDWRRQEEQMGRPRSAEASAQPAPLRTEAARPAPVYAAARAKAQPPLPKHILLIMAALAVIVIGTAFVVAKKTRGPGSVNLLDPSRPTAKPSKPGDPIPALRAPTRPQRD